jgi:hypothetical protein
MASATLHGPLKHRQGTAYTVEAFTEEDEYGPFEAPWRGFTENMFGESWSYEWQTRAGRLLLLAERAQRGELEVPDALQNPEFQAYVERIADKFRDRECEDEEVADDELPTRIMMAMWNGRVNPAEPDDDYGLYTYTDASLEALRALPLPRWARILDGRPKGKLLLVFERGRSMEDFHRWLEHPRMKPTRGSSTRPAATSKSLKDPTRRRPSAIRTRRNARAR